ncbi:hypothetical protein JCM6882_002111 [Rhodosporidiobolus microsporus]
MMRRGHKSNAIMNSPIVRSFIKPVQSIVPAPAPASSSTTPALASTSTAAAGAEGGVKHNPYLAHLDAAEQAQREDGEEDAGPFLIPTQPPTPTLNGRGSGGGEAGPSSERDTKGKKRARPEQEGEKEEEVVEYDAVRGTRFGNRVRWTGEGDVPEDLQKYWAQRYRLFSLFDDGCEMDREGWYSVTPENIAAQIAERCRCGVIVDAFCGVGGNAIQFAFTCEKVIALDISPTRLACARRNAEIYGVADRITFLLADWVSWTEDYLARDARGEVKNEDRVEVVFLSPPWGGIDYQTAGAAEPAQGPKKKKARYSHLDSSAPLAPPTPTPALSSPALALSSTPSAAPLPAPTAYPLSALAPQHGAALFRLARRVTPNVAYYLPRNVDLLEVAGLTRVAPWEERPGEEMVEVEEEWMGWKLKAVTAYFGELAEQGEVDVDQQEE